MSAHIGAPRRENDHIRLFSQTTVALPQVANFKITKFPKGLTTFPTAKVCFWSYGVFIGMDRHCTPWSRTFPPRCDVQAVGPTNRLRGKNLQRTQLITELSGVKKLRPGKRDHAIRDRQWELTPERLTAQRGTIFTGHLSGESYLPSALAWAILVSQLCRRMM